MKQSTTRSSLHRRIMRRVWYSYLLSVLISQSTLRGLVLGFSGVLFVQLVSIHNIVLNLLAVQLGSVPNYLWQVVAGAVRGGEFLTLLTLGILVFSLLSFRLPKGLRYLPKSKVSAA